MLSAFVKDGRITALPAAAGRRMVLLDWLVQDFEPGRRFTEQQVNAIIAKRHADTAALRREL